MPSRTSDASKATRGTLRADRGVKHDPTHKLTAAPRPPLRLSERAKAEWRALAGPLVRAGGLCELDLRLLEILAEALADEAAASATLQRDGYTVASGAGVVKQHPAIRLGREARAMSVRLLCELGCSPASRQRIDLAPPPTDEGGPWAQMRALQSGRIAPGGALARPGPPAAAPLPFLSALPPGAAGAPAAGQAGGQADERKEAGTVAGVSPGPGAPAGPPAPDAGQQPAAPDAPCGPRWQRPGPSGGGGAGNA